MSSKQVNLAENNGSALAITAATFLALTYFSVILRVYVRVWLTKSFLADDWLMLVAQVCCPIPKRSSSDRSASWRGSRLKLEHDYFVFTGEFYSIMHLHPHRRPYWHREA